MTVVQAIGAAVAGLLAVAMVSVVVNPQSKLAEIIKASGQAFSDNIKAAKSFS